MDSKSNSCLDKKALPAVLFVCLGNICRSPAAEGFLKHLARKNGIANKWRIESCAMGDWHIGALPDARMRKGAEKRGVVLNSRAQPFQNRFFSEFDYILAADESILAQLKALTKSEEERFKVMPMTAFSAKYTNAPVPDPYYGGEEAFEHTLDMIVDSCEGLWQHFQ